jgi:2-polyprenyl-6-methoxyphenol hydroxylase-like FAD-dependent oxidoreductase
MGGLFATALLRRAGWDAQVYERTPVELFGRGAGISTQAELLQVLELSGASLHNLGITVRERIALNRDGEVVERLAFEQIMTSWDRYTRSCVQPSLIPFITSTTTWLR